MRKARAFFFCAVSLNLVLLLARPAGAAWSTDPAVNVPLCTASGYQFEPSAVSDGAGGAIVTWTDYRSGTPAIYAQRISAAGTVQWTADGVLLCTAACGQLTPVITLDGTGGAIVAWWDCRNDPDHYDIYAQRISADGVIQWTVSGVPLCTAPGDQFSQTITSDGAGGAIVTWEDHRNVGTTLYDIYAQRISAAGTVLWAVNGVAVCTAASLQMYPTIASDGAGGAIVAWGDQRSGSYDIYAQRISAAGTVQWPANGVALCTATSRVYRRVPEIVSDGAGGAIVAWGDQRSANADIYAQRVSAGGTVQWPANGVALCTTAGDQYFPRVVSDGAGGAIVTWQDDRTGSEYTGDVYVQRVSANGVVLWPADGVALCTAGGGQGNPMIVTDGAGGAVVTWQDGRVSNSGIYAQRISVGGATQWTADGVALCTGGGGPTTIVSDGAGGAIDAWQDERNAADYDIYAQNVNADGSLGGVTTPVMLSLVSADIGADVITLTWFAGGSKSPVATLYRSLQDNNWARIGVVTTDGSGYLRYMDRVEATATRVGYRLGVVDAGIEGFYGETWVDLPALDLALDGVRPNPTQGSALSVEFTLPSAASARVELLDVSGRQVVEREVGSLGAGRHTLDLSGGRRLAPGLYLVCLRQGANTRVTRVAVLR